MNESKNDKKINIIDEALDWIETLVLYCFIALLIFTFVCKLVIVDGPSMEPTLYNNQKLIVSNLFYKPQNGDIIIFNNKTSLMEKTLVKRVIATEGQRVKIDFETGFIYIDGTGPIKEGYIKDATTLVENYETYYEKDEDGYITVPEGCVFVLGDNRNNSTDSRSASVGFVPVDNIIGKVIFRIFPFKLYL